MLLLAGIATQHRSLWVDSARHAGIEPMHGAIVREVPVPPLLSSCLDAFARFTITAGLLNPRVAQRDVHFWLRQLTGPFSARSHSNPWAGQRRLLCSWQSVRLKLC